MNHVIELKDIKKIYHIGGEDFAALAGITLNIEEGEFAALMGPSGSGKSTLMNILGCLDRPTSGSYKLGGKEVAHLSDDELAVVRNRHIGFVFQSFNLIDELNVYENVELPLIYLKKKASEKKERVSSILDRMNISHRVKHFPQQLSGGQQQRVAIARAVVAGPKLILADEPTGNLDEKNSREVMELLKKANREFGKTIVLVTHDPEAAGYADSAIHLVDGKCVKK